jgi:riboflavin biosynthesis pyrimidine reductase
MRELWPSAGADVDPAVVHATAARVAPGRPWVLSNMIASVDGAATDPGGTSGGLGGPADKAVFAAIRSVADVIVVGAGTATAENYGPARLTPALRAQRAERGQAPVPRIAVVTTSLRIDPGQWLFREAGEDARPIVLTTARADADRRRALATVAEVVEVGDDTVEWPRALALLGSRFGAAVVLCEGGPRTNAQLVAEGLLDEQCLTVAPALVDGAAPRIAAGAWPGRLVRMRLDHVLTEDGYLFLRYVRDDGPTSDTSGSSGSSGPPGP